MTFEQVKLIMSGPRGYAMLKHAGQKYGHNPYVYHLDMVAHITAQVTTDSLALTAAYLHDVVEDTGTSLNVIHNTFGPLVATWVAHLTPPVGNRKFRAEATNERYAVLEFPDHEVLIIKAADRLANMRHSLNSGDAKLLKMYRREYPAFRAAVHRNDLCDWIWDELDHIALPRVRSQAA
jgi:(p)ppGpp synthase/HD superfamily hydrolase